MATTNIRRNNNTLLPPSYNASNLYLDSLRRLNAANDGRVYLRHRGVMNLAPYQLDPALQALSQTRCAF